MSTKTIGVVGRGSGWQKVGIELGLRFFYPNSSQPGMFQTFARNSWGKVMERSGLTFKDFSLEVV